MIFQIPEESTLRIMTVAIANEILISRFQAALLIVGTTILQTPIAGSAPAALETALSDFAKRLGNDAGFRLESAKKCVIFAVSTGAILANDATIANQDPLTFDDNTVSDAVILDVLTGLATNLSLLTSVGLGA